jgi:predicted metalloendopeptidase
MNEQVIKAYQQYIQDIAKSLGAQGTDAAQFATEMFYLEKRIAFFTPSRQEIQDPVDTYNKVTVRELKDMAKSVRNVLCFSSFPSRGDFN